ncbi:MAG: Rid family detoxifying hydrolase [Candidatus Eisenbacteria bacterium]
MKSPLHVEDAPKAIGPYAQAQVVRLHGGNKMLFSSGQIALDPATMELVEGGVKEQAERVLLNLVAVLRGAGLGLADVVKTTVYLVDMQDFQAMNEVYARHFGDGIPARTTIAAAGLPRGAKVEIDVVAFGRDL